MNGKGTTNNVVYLAYHSTSKSICMKQSLKKIAPFVVAACILMVSMSLPGTSHAQSTRPSADTVPQKKGQKITDLDEAIKELDKGLMDVERELKKQDWKKIEADVKASMKDLDMAKMEADLQKAMREIDVEKINAEVQKALKGLDVEKMKAEVQAALASIDMKKINAELLKIKEIDIKAIEEEMAKIKPGIEAALKDAKVHIEKAKAEMEEFKGFIDGLEKEGLINKKEPYTLEHKGGKLIINGKEQSEAVYNRYRTFLEKHKSFTIKRDSDDFNIDLD